MTKFRQCLKSEISLNSLIKATIEILKRYHVDHKLLDSQRPAKNNETNIWNRIARAYFKRTEYKDVINIYSWWKRNTKGYRKFIEDSLPSIPESEEEMQIDDDFKSIDINISKDEVSILKSFILIYDYSSQFNSSFSDFLSEKIQEKGFSCWVSCRSNRFKKRFSQKKKSQYWSGTYQCIVPNCRSIYKCVIDDTERNKRTNHFSNELCIKVTFEKKNDHKKATKVNRCSGYKRQRQSEIVMGNGIVNTIIENTIHNQENQAFLDQKITNRFTLGMMKSALKHFYKISNEAFVDALAAKNLTDQIFSESETHLKGYVQEISLSPFGFLMLSQIQVNIWSSIKKFHSVWYFDATGTIHKKIANQRKPFFYSIVVHDVKNKVFFPFSEFVTTAQDQTSISKYLGLIKNKIQKDMLPDIIVVDMS
ncbi:hypothetical protein BpHYR1_009395 [Brachionus plicatilis]|uniref:Uncharacterized protein n=1 Tax=Brachionus plicatilis TaxID=10195 RepID=A0A3M7PGL3_BRAPC|nr:hypothetical protein BpHYR1_009395 [Brachionus plicatilis]